MRQFAAFLILIGLFTVLVGSQFQASDADKLEAVARRLGCKVRSALPPNVDFSGPIQSLRKLLPMNPDEAVRARLAADKRLANIAITVVTEDGAIKLRGVVPDAKTRKIIVSLAENTIGVEKVVDELGVLE